jgi:hypothetical protein
VPRCVVAGREEEAGRACSHLRSLYVSVSEETELVGDSSAWSGILIQANTKSERKLYDHDGSEKIWRAREQGERRLD